MVYRGDFRLAPDSASTRAEVGFAAAEGRCRRCGESWKGVNGIYCGRLRRYVERAGESQLRYMGCPKV